MLRCLKPLDDWDPAQGAELMKRLWQEFAKEAETDVTELKRAYNRVIWDGYYGPVPDEEWNECHDPENATGHMTMARARELLRSALNHDPHVSYFDPEYGHMCDGVGSCCHPDHGYADEPGPMFHEEECVVDPWLIKREMFSELIEIYGHLSI